MIQEIQENSQKLEEFEILSKFEDGHPLFFSFISKVQVSEEGKLSNNEIGEVIDIMKNDIDGIAPWIERIEEDWGNHFSSTFSFSQPILSLEELHQIFTNYDTNSYNIRVGVMYVGRWCSIRFLRELLGKLVVGGEMDDKSQDFLLDLIRGFSLTHRLPSEEEILGRYQLFHQLVLVLSSSGMVEGGGKVVEMGWWIACYSNLQNTIDQQDLFSSFLLLLLSLQSTTIEGIYPQSQLALIGGCEAGIESCLRVKIGVEGSNSQNLLFISSLLPSPNLSSHLINLAKHTQDPLFSIVRRNLNPKEAVFPLLHISVCHLVNELFDESKSNQEEMVEEEGGHIIPILLPLIDSLDTNLIQKGSILLFKIVVRLSSDSPTIQNYQVTYFKKIILTNRKS